MAFPRIQTLSKVDFRQLEAWYRTLDQLVAAKERIEVALYHRLRDLFSFKPDLVLYDITSTYFEGVGPASFAKHGYSRDGKPQYVQSGLRRRCWPSWRRFQSWLAPARLRSRFL